MQDFVEWCLQNHLQINPGEPRSWRWPSRATTFSTDPEDYLKLRVHLNNKLDWPHNGLLCIGKVRTDSSYSGD